VSCAKRALKVLLMVSDTEGIKFTLRGDQSLLPPGRVENIA
jgi:hypothetical protein